jgi:uncharacterized protein (DUF58 family)
MPPNLPLTLPPDVRSRLRRLTLRTRSDRGTRGFGMHPSRNKGAGLEFAQYRAYEPGDEPRRIDWKLFARSDKFFVREAEEDSPVSVWLLIDASASMGQADRARPQWSRMDAAKLMALCVAELAQMQGDRFGWIMLQERGLGVAEPASGRLQMDRLQIDFAKAQPAGAFPGAATLAPLWERIGPHDLVVFLSDCFDEAGIALIERLAKAGREVLAVQLLTAEERDFPFDGGYRFRDQESEAALIGDGKALRASFLARFAAARARLTERLDSAGIRHTAYVLDEAIDAPLQTFFGKAGAR